MLFASVGHLLASYAIPPPLRPDVHLTVSKHQCIRETVCDEEKEALAQLKEHWNNYFPTHNIPPLTPFETLHYTDLDLLRFLRARENNVLRAVNMLSEELRYRRAHNLSVPQLGLPLDVLRDNNGNGAMYRCGFDLERHPIIIIQ